MFGPSALFTGAQLYLSGEARHREWQGNQLQAVAERKRLKAEQQIADIKAQRSRVQAIRQARIAKAQAEAQAYRGGVEQSSGSKGFQAGATSQLFNNYSTSLKIGDIARETSIFNINASIESGRLLQGAANYQGGANAAGSMGSIFSSYSGGGGQQSSTV